MHYITRRSVNNKSTLCLTQIRSDILKLEIMCSIFLKVRPNAMYIFAGRGSNQYGSVHLLRLTDINCIASKTFSIYFPK